MLWRCAHDCCNDRTGIKACSCGGWVGGHAGEQAASTTRCLTLLHAHCLLLCPQARCLPRGRQVSRPAAAGGRGAGGEAAAVLRPARGAAPCAADQWAAVAQAGPNQVRARGVGWGARANCVSSSMDALPSPPSLTPNTCHPLPLHPPGPRSSTRPSCWGMLWAWMPTP